MLFGQPNAFGRQHGRQMPRRSTRKLKLDGRIARWLQRIGSAKNFAECVPVNTGWLVTAEGEPLNQSE
jgi:hypothetical protein